MVYRHIYWGLLNIAPGKHNSMTEAAKTASFLVKVVSPVEYATKEEAEKDAMQYCFKVFDDQPTLEGFWGVEGPEKDPIHDIYQEVIQEMDWSRYRLIKLRTEKEILEGRYGDSASVIGTPNRKAWKKLFPAYGCYPLTKVAYSVVALPDVKMGGRQRCRYQ